MQIRRRLEGREASTRQAAESKRVFESEGGFIMKRWRGGPRAASLSLHATGQLRGWRPCPLPQNGDLQPFPNF